MIGRTKWFLIEVVLRVQSLALCFGHNFSARTKVGWLVGWIKLYRPPHVILTSPTQPTTVNDYHDDSIDTIFELEKS